MLFISLYLLYTHVTNTCRLENTPKSQAACLEERIFVASYSNTVYRHRRAQVSLSPSLSLCLSVSLPPLVPLSFSLGKGVLWGIERPRGICLSAECHLVVKAAMTHFFQSHSWQMLTEEKWHFIMHCNINAGHTQIVSTISIKMKRGGGGLARGQADYDTECSSSDMTSITSCHLMPVAGSPSLTSTALTP